MSVITKAGGILIICSLIIGGSIVIVQQNKQESIEIQQQRGLEVEREALQYQKDKDEEIKNAETFSRALIRICIAEAENSYWDFLELNGTGKRSEEGGVTALTRYWDTAKEDRENAINNCYRKYQ